MSTTPSQSNSISKSRSSSHVAFVETITLSSDDDEDEKGGMISQITTKDVIIEQNLVEEVQIDHLVGHEEEQVQDWEDITDSSDDDDIIIMDFAPDKTRTFLGSRKSGSGPSGLGITARLPISRVSATMQTPRKLRGKKSTRKSDNLLAFSVPLPKLEIQDDEMKDSSQSIPEV